MGKSDKFIFPEYSNLLPRLEYGSIAFLGFSSENHFTSIVKSSSRHFYDLSLGNWEINSNWSLQQEYDLIVCTRCAYFSKDPDNFIKKVKNHLSKNGIALIDWGLGDHWRFEKYKVGWVKDNEHEFAYGVDNKLHSCLWRDEFSSHKEAIKFWEAVKSNKLFGYDNTDSLSEVVKKEIPQLVNYEYDKLSLKFLWPDSPQLYIITTISQK